MQVQEVLEQNHDLLKNQTWHPIVYFSHALRDYEKR